MSIGRGMDKENGCIRTMKYYSAAKKNEIMSFAATWMDLEIVIQSEVRQRSRNITQHLSHVESKRT